MGNLSTRLMGQTNVSLRSPETGSKSKIAMIATKFDFREHYNMVPISQKHHTVVITQSTLQDGKIPSVIFTYYTGILHLVLHRLDITTIPEEIQSLSNLKTLKIYECKNITSIPESIGKLQELIDINITSSPLVNTSSLEKVLRKLRQIQKIMLVGCGLTHIPEQIMNLTMLKYLVVSHNKISTIPVEIGQLTMLTYLNVSNNNISTIPVEIGQLTMLDTLHVSDNNISTIPVEIGQLTMLETLHVRDNNISTIPVEIGQLTRLWWLHASNNNISTIPVEIGQLTMLEVLNVSNNNISTIPVEIGQLTKLEDLNVSNNKISTIPVEIGQLPRLRDLKLDGNPLTTPPQDVCKIGIQAIRQYYRDIEETGTKVSGRQKLILLGDTGHGKTSLARTLLHGKSRLADEDDRTQVLEKHTWEADKDISIMIHDFGGHDVYNITHPLFITDQAIIVLVFGLFVAEDFIHKALQRWLATIWNICPAASVLVVGTHFDKLSDDLVTEEKISKYISDVKQSKLDATEAYITNTERKIEECKSQPKTIYKQVCQNKLSHYRGIHEMLKKAKINVHFVSSSETMSGIMRLKMEIVKRAKQRQFKLPLAWIQVADEIKANSGHIMSLEEVKEIASQKRIKDSVDILITFLYNVGDILYYKENKNLKDTIFTNPQKVIDVMRSLFHHDPDTFFKWDDLKHSHYLDKKMFRQAKKRFITKGILTKKLLMCIWSDFSLNETGTCTTAFIEMLKHFNLCFSCSNSDVKMFQFPWYLKNKSTKELPPFCYDPYFVQISITFTSDEIPQAFYENSSVILEQYLKPTDYRLDASSQVYVKRNNTEFFMCVTRSKIDEISPNIKLTAFGKDTSEMWYFISNMTKEMEDLLENNWPGALYDITLDCPHCLLTGDQDPHPFDIFKYDSEVTTLTCDKSGEDVPAVLLFKIPKDCKPTEDQKNALTKWTKSNIDVPFAKEDQKHTETLLKVSKYLSNRNDVNSFGIYLVGVTSKDIEAAFTNNPHDINKAAYDILLKWFNNNSHKSADANFEQLKQVCVKCKRCDIIADILS